ncbi:DUF2637 domain-containing protein [Streptomyces sp. NPDC006990]|uniref:DUF2637 domain-containing protein n=1 Tax=Streptomyces sp. NPDC006990 TaxID=3154481 RepID=UPI003454494B
MTTKKLTGARREVERLRLEASGATDSDVQIWEAGNRVTDLERKERQAAVHAARHAALAMDVALFAVAALVMAFSLGNIRQFAEAHGVDEPISWFIAPAVDLALVAALIGDAVLSRHQLDAGVWATRLRYVSGALTLVLNSWESAVAKDPAGLLLHAGMPVLLFVLAEAASPYRRQFAETVRLAAEAVDTEETAPVSTPAPAEADAVDTAPEPVLVQEADTVYDQTADPAVSTRTPQVDGPAPTWHSESVAAVDWVLKGEGDMPRRTVDTADRPLSAEDDDRLSAADAKRAIEAAWAEGLTVREAAERATRGTSYVGKVYARLTRERGHQPSRGQTRIGEVAA